MTVGGLIAILIGFWCVVEVFAWSFRQPDGIINPKPSPVADGYWPSRRAAVVFCGIFVSVCAIGAGLLLGFIALVTSGALNERII